MTEKEVLQKMKADIQFRGLSESTIKNYTRNVKAFLKFCNNRPIEILKPRRFRYSLMRPATIRECQLIPR